jgi:hypothetical protein
MSINASPHTTITIGEQDIVESVLKRSAQGDKGVNWAPAAPPV